jgi:hypothetical protein
VVLTHQLLDRERFWDAFALEVKLVNVAGPEALCLVLPSLSKVLFGLERCCNEHKG